jgi:hypothetical protein
VHVFGGCVLARERQVAVEEGANVGRPRIVNADRVLDHNGVLSLGADD